MDTVDYQKHHNGTISVPFIVCGRKYEAQDFLHSHSSGVQCPRFCDIAGLRRRSHNPIFARAYYAFSNSRAIGDLAGSDQIKSVHLAEALHRRSPEDQDVINIFFEDDICFVNEQTLS